MTVWVTTCGQGVSHGLAQPVSHGAPQSLRFLPHSRLNSPPRPPRPLSQFGAAGATVQVTVTGTHTHSQTVRFCLVTTGTCE